MLKYINIWTRRFNEYATCDENFESFKAKLQIKIPPVLVRLQLSWECRLYRKNTELA